MVAGGEVAFVRAILADSLILRGRVRWYVRVVMAPANAKLKILVTTPTTNTNMLLLYQVGTTNWYLDRVL